MPTRNAIGDKALEEYLELLELVEEETEHENALAEVRDDGLMEVFRLHTYHNTDYPVEDFNSIVEHIEELIEKNDFPEFEVFEVGEYEGEKTRDVVPDSIDTYTQVTFEPYGY
jgi:hypothetical protein